MNSLVSKESSANTATPFSFSGTSLHRVFGVPTYAGPLGVDLEIGADSFSVHIDDGRVVTLPYELFPRLAHASSAARRNWRWTGEGIGIHWPDLDEDIRVGRLVEPEAIVTRDG